MTADDLAERCLMPEVSRLWDISGIVGLAVARQAVADGVTTIKSSDELEGLIERYRWHPVYPEFVEE